jgi:hypothetical protein
MKTFVYASMLSDPKILLKKKNDKDINMSDLLSSVWQWTCGEKFWLSGYANTPQIYFAEVSLSDSSSLPTEQYIIILFSHQKRTM